MIFAAGMGTRLRPLTDRMPKALVPVSGHPLLEIAAARLRRAGATELVVNVHHFADQITAYLAEHDLGLPIRVSDESAELLDTGGGLRHALPLFSRSAGDEPILIHNVDILSNADLPALHAQHTAGDGALLLVSERETSRYLLFDDAMRLVGWTNTATGEVRSPYTDLRPEGLRHYAFSGIHSFSPRLYPFMESFPPRFSIIDFYLSICDRIPIRACLQPGLRLLDVGKQDTLTRAEEFLRATGGC